MRLVRRRQPFSHPEWLYEIKHDGFRALAFVQDRQVRLVSRNGYAFKRLNGLAALLGRDLKVRSAVLDGEIVRLAPDGRTIFNDLLYRRGEPFFYAFDVLSVGNEDFRYLPLIDRKLRLLSIIKPQTSRLLYVDHVEERGEDLSGRRQEPRPGLLCSVCSIPCCSPPLQNEYEEFYGEGRPF